MIFRDQILPSGMKIKVASFNFVRDREDRDRTQNKDWFALEYVSSVNCAESEARNKEALEAFELIRPISEQWGLHTALIAAFQSPKRNGAYEKYIFKRSADGKWFYSRYPANVQIDE